MIKGKLNNVTKIRQRVKEKGTFTNVNNSIIFDKRINANSKMLLISIISDSDSFDISQSLYCKRFNWDKKQFSRAMKQLEDAGYIKRELMADNVSISGIKKKGSKKILYHYTVSEFGNLNENSSNNNLKKAS